MAQSKTKEQGQGQRKAETKKRRRRRDVNLGEFDQRMTIPQEVQTWAELNHKRLRFVNDEKARIQKLQAQDWDFVQNKGGEVGEIEQPGDLGDMYSITVGTGKNGQPIIAYLMCKDKDFDDEDFKAKQAQVDQIDSAIKQGGNSNKAEADSTEYVKKVNYNPKGDKKPRP